MKKFRAGFNDSIECFEIVRETAKQIVYLERGRERREAKESNYSSWFDTKQEAKDFLIFKCNEKIKHFEQMVEYSKQKLAKIQEL